MAEQIVEGIRLIDSNVVVKVYNLAKSDVNDLITEVFKSKTVIMGSPTIGNSILPVMAGFIHLVKELKFKDKKASAFGCYGWSGESVTVLNELMNEAGFTLIGDGFKNLWNPDDSAKLKAQEFGKIIAQSSNN